MYLDQMTRYTAVCHKQNQQVLYDRACFIYSELKIEKVGWLNTQVSCADFPNYFEETSVLWFEGCVCFATSVCLPGPSGFLDRPNETLHKKCWNGYVAV